MIFTNNEILAGIRNRDNKVLDYIYEKFFPKARSIILRRGGNPKDADDAYQDVMFDFLNRGDSMQTNESFVGYFIRACEKKWLNNLRKSKNTLISATIIELEDFGDKELEDIDRIAEQRKLLKIGWEKLSVNCKQVLQKKYYEKLKYEQISVVLEKTITALKKQVFDCKERLKQTIRTMPESKLYFNEYSE